jgi:DNA uptake protein ComE-like DNA-binding protein
MSMTDEIPDRAVRITAFASLGIIAAVSAFLLLVPAGDQAGIEIESVVYINTDPVESIARLPGIGHGLAGEIVRFREQAKGEKAFESPQDLCRVRGIGKKKSEAILPYISFE